MKKQNSLAEFFKSKSFYALLCVGALAIIAMSLIGLNQPSNKGNNLVDLNEPNGVELDYVQGEDELNLALDNNNPTSEEIANIPSDNSNEVAKSDEDGFYVGESLPSDVYENNALIAGTEEPVEVVTKPSTESSTEVVTETAPVVEPARPVMKLESLYFDEESILSWPLTGEVIVSYNKKFENQTKKLWESLEAICISANIDDTVRAAADGIVKSVVEVDGQLGTTVTVSLGNGYELTYGQLKDVKVKSGDYVEVGQSIAKVAKVSSYYTSENNHLYLSLNRLEGETTVSVDPMLYLASKEQ